jgi:branched-chain amino acid aminotransferase
MPSVWLNGQMLPQEEATISLSTHGLHYGTSAFEGIRFYRTESGRSIFRLREHLERLRYSSEVIQMDIPYSTDELVAATIETIKANEYESGYIRPLVFFGEGGLGIDTSKNEISVAIMVMPWGKYLPKDLVAIKTVSVRRPNPLAFDLSAKLGGMYINSVRAHQEAVMNGYDEALLLTDANEVAEGAGQNIFIVKDGVIATPPIGNILPGLTRDAVIAIARDNGYTVEEKVLTMKDLYGADECFFTGTATEITAVGKIDATTIRPHIGPVVKQLKELFSEIVQGRNATYEKWLTPVK